jgi:hypothetical protein
MTRYRLAAFDLDGTLLNSQNAMSDGNAAALAKLAADGVIVVAATARSWQSAMRHFEPRGLTPAGAVCAGADVRASDGGVIRQWPLPAEFVDFVAREADAANWTVTLSAGERTIRREVPLPDWGNRPYLQLVTALSGVDTSGTLTALIQGAEMENFSAWAEAATLSTAASFDGTELITATHAEADKGRALRALCEALGIAPDECVAFGDSEVDLPMFAVAGLSVATANGAASVRGRADMVTGTNDADGVAAAITRIWA